MDHRKAAIAFRERLLTIYSQFSTMFARISLGLDFNPLIAYIQRVQSAVLI